jgi:hypothetical protein
VVKLSKLSELLALADISEYVTLEEAENDERVPYTRYWLRKLCQDAKIEAEKFGTGRRAVWLVHIPSLLDYIAEMDALGTQKHAT